MLAPQRASRASWRAHVAHARRRLSRHLSISPMSVDSNLGCSNFGALFSKLLVRLGDSPKLLAVCAFVPLFFKVAGNLQSCSKNLRVPPVFSKLLVSKVAKYCITRQG